MTDLFNMMLVSGTGRNSGKTSVATELIGRFSSAQNLTAVKVSPHQHGSVEGTIPILKDTGFCIYEDFNKNTRKDTSRMLLAGAAKSYYIETTDRYAFTAFMKLYSLVKPGSPIICESPAMRSYIKPGIFIIADHSLVMNKKTSVQQQFQLSNLIIDIHAANWQHELDPIKFEHGHWKIITNQD